MSKPLLPAHDKLSEALLGLVVLASREHMTHDQMARLVEQFRENYPEIILLQPGDVLRSARRPAHA